jgi:hypothetical protein
MQAGGLMVFARNQRDEARFLGDCPATRNPAGLPFCSTSGQSNAGLAKDMAGTLTCHHEQPFICEPELARTLTARGDSSACSDRGQNIVAHITNSPYAKADAQAQEASHTAQTTPDATGESDGSLARAVICAQKPPSAPAITLRMRDGCEGGGKGPLLQKEQSGTLATGNDQYLFAPIATGVHQRHDGRINTSETAYCLTSAGNATSRNAPLVACGFDLQQITSKQNRSTLKEVQPTLCADGNPHVVSADACSAAAPDPIPIHDKATRHQGGGSTRNGDGCGNGLGIGRLGDPAFTITTGDHHAVAAVDCRNHRETTGISGTLQAKDGPGYSLNYQNPIRFGYTVRRLTPIECERLQGFPDGWTRLGAAGDEISDTRRYQMLGNSVAIPCVAYVLSGIAAKMRFGGDPAEKEAGVWPT